MSERDNPKARGAAGPAMNGGAGLLSRWWSLIAYGLRLGLAVVFLLAAWVKLQNMSGALPGVTGIQNFAEAIQAYRLNLPAWLVSWASYGVPLTEVAVAVALILGLWTRAAALVYILLMGVFMYGIASVLSRGLDIKCGCFGDLRFFCQGMVDQCKLWENGAFAAGAALLLLFGPGRLSMDWIARRG